MATPEQVLSIARKEIGYSRWNDLQPGTKYGRWYANLTKNSYYGTSGVPYCAMFVSWVFMQANQQAVSLPGAYCPWMVNDVKKSGMYISVADAQPGDIVFFDWNGDGESDHVGIVEANYGTWLQTIEGNVDGGIVARKARNLQTVTCICRPSWTLSTIKKTGLDLSRGIDIYNGEGDAGMRGDETNAAFVICKTSEGITFKDNYAAEFASNILAAGKLLGFYHFARQNDAVAEADFFVKCATETGHIDEATLWLDYESTAISNGPKWCKRFIDRVNRLTGKRCGIYASRSVVATQDFSEIASYTPLWLAQYATSDMIHGWQDMPWSQKPYGAWGNECAIHQYGGGYVDGWHNALDLNRGYFTEDQWNAWSNHNNAAPDEPAQIEPGKYVNVIEVDGWIGPKTVAELQRQLGTYVDGVISGQARRNASRLQRVWSITWTETGSPMIRKLQSILDVHVDGYLGPQTIMALQSFLGVDTDGYLGQQTATALQNSINEGVWL